MDVEGVPPFFYHRGAADEGSQCGEATWRRAMRKGRLCLSHARAEDRTSMNALARVFPCLAALRRPDADPVELVNQTIVEEVLLCLGKLDLGKGVTARRDVALWRERGGHRP